MVEVQVECVSSESIPLCDSHVSWLLQSCTPVPLTLGGGAPGTRHWLNVSPFSHPRRHPHGFGSSMCFHTQMPFLFCDILPVNTPLLGAFRSPPPLNHGSLWRTFEAQDICSLHIPEASPPLPHPTGGRRQGGLGEVGCRDCSRIVLRSRMVLRLFMEIPPL